MFKIKNAKKFRSLKTTTTATFVALSLFVLLVSLGLELYINFQAQHSAIIERQHMVAQSATVDVANFLEEKFVALSQAFDLGNLAHDSSERALVMSKLIGRDKSLRQLYILDNAGQELARSVRLPTMTQGSLEKYREFILKSTAEKKRYISPVYFDERTNEPIVLIAVPTTNMFHDPEGSFVAEVNLKFMWDLVSSIKIGTNGLAYVIDSEGTLIAFRDTSRVLAHENVSWLHEVSEYMNGDDPIDHDGPSLGTGIEGTVVVSTFHSLGFPAWAVVVELPAREAYAYLLQSLGYSLLVIIFGILIAVVSGVYFSKRLTRGIISLNNATREISRGQLDAVIDISPENKSNEIGQLGESFTVMTEKLKEFQSSMEKKVEEKTIALQEQIAETESRAEELKKFQLAAENTSQHIIITDANAVIIYANKAVVQTTGYTHEEVIGKNPSLWGGQMSKEFYAHMWKTIKTDKKNFSGEILNKRKNGELYTAAAVISPIVGSDGEVKFYVGLESDVSKQKALEKMLIEEKEHIEKTVVARTQELSDEHARLFASINSLSFGFIIADMDDHVLLQNNAMGKLFDQKNGEKVSISNIAHLIGEHFDLKMQIEQCFTDKSACTIKEIAMGKKFLRGTIAPVLGENSERIGYVLLLEDITEARSLERSRDEFFSIASHELRTPLTAIRGNASMLKDFYADKMPDADMGEMVSDILTSSERLINIVNDFLAVSRLEQKRMEFKSESFDIVQMIKKTITEFDAIAKPRNLTVRLLESGSPVPNIFADPDRVKQVIVNLISNAINYTIEGGVEVAVVEHDGFVKVSVKDTGVGIAPMYQPLLFRKFQQAGEKILTRVSSQGTGLGLYISKLIVVEMGGEIFLEASEPGKGSTFVFTLPTA